VSIDQEPTHRAQTSADPLFERLDRIAARILERD
jgi:hypothetical protein